MHREKLLLSLSLTGLLALLPFSGLSAQSAVPTEEAGAARPAFSYLSAKLAPGAMADARVEIAVDLALLAEDPAQLSIELPDGRSYTAIRIASWTAEGGRRYWSGGLHADGVIGKEPSGTLSLSVEGGIVAGFVQVPEGALEVVPLAAGLQKLVPAAATRGDHTEAHCVPAQTAAEALREESVELDPGTSKYPPSIVDVLVAFPRSLAGSSTQAMQTRATIAAWFDAANLALANSNVVHRYRAVYSGPLLGAQPPAATSFDPAPVLGLQWLQQQPPGSEVLALRDSHHADLVALFVPQDQHLNCGVAELGTPSTDQFAVIDIGCSGSEYLVAHELGHNLGMGHALDENGASSPYSFTFGYDNDNTLMVGGNRAATVMACNGNGPGGAANPTLTGNQCNRIPYFSHNNLTVGGVAIGHASANNTHLARVQMYHTSLRRTAPHPGNQPPQVVILRPQAVYGQYQQQLTLGAMAWDIESGNLDANVQWTSNVRGHLGWGAQLRVPGSVFGNEIFTARVTDPNGLTYATSVTLNFQSMVVTEGAIWHDPQTPGRFLSFNKTSGGSWVATWMAFEGSNPVWYLSPALPVSSVNGSFSTQLYRATRNPATGDQSVAVYADLTVAVETENQIRVIVDPIGAGATVDLMLQPYTRATGPGGYLSPSDGGWTIWTGPTTFGLEYQQVRLLITFDGWQPVWVMGFGVPPWLVTQPYAMTMYRPTPSTLTSNYALPTGGSVGSLAFTNNFTYASVSLSFPSGNTWIRPSVPIVPVSVR